MFDLKKATDKKNLLYILTNILLLTSSYLYVKQISSFSAILIIAIYLVISVSLVYYSELLYYRKLLFAYPLIIIPAFLPLIFINFPIDKINSFWFSLLNLFIFIGNFITLNSYKFTEVKINYNKFWIIAITLVISVSNIVIFENLLGTKLIFLLYAISISIVIFTRYLHLKNDSFASTEKYSDIIIPSIYAVIMIILFASQLFFVEILDNLSQIRGIILYELIIIIVFSVFFSMSFDYPLRFLYLSIITLLIPFVPQTFISYALDPAHLIFGTVFILIFSIKPRIVWDKVSDFSTIKILHNRLYDMYILINNDVIHGTQFANKTMKNSPIAYMSKTGPVGNLFELFDNTKMLINNIGVIGLGAGVMSYYIKNNQNIIFYEIDPAIVELVQSGKFFDYTLQCKGNVVIKTGDAREKITHEANNYFDILTIDAYYGLDIPLNLYDKESLEIYAHKIKNNGIILFHVSGDNINLPQIIINNLKKLDFHVAIKDYCPEIGNKIDKPKEYSENIFSNNKRDFITNLHKKQRPKYTNEFIEIFKNIGSKIKPFIVNSLSIFIKDDNYNPLIDANSSWIVASKQEIIINDLNTKYNWSIKQYDAKVKG